MGVSGDVIYTVGQLLDSVASKYNIKSPEEFTCEHMRKLAEILNWERKPATSGVASA